jgi:hypothetical protein
LETESFSIIFRGYWAAVYTYRMIFSNRLISRCEHFSKNKLGVFCWVLVAGDGRVDTVSAELHWVAPDFVPEENQCEALPCMQTII